MFDFWRGLFYTKILWYLSYLAAGMILKLSKPPFILAGCECYDNRQKCPNIGDYWITGGRLSGYHCICFWRPDIESWLHRFLITDWLDNWLPQYPAMSWWPAPWISSFWTAGYPVLLDNWLRVIRVPQNSNHHLTEFDKVVDCDLVSCVLSVCLSLTFFFLFLSRSRSFSIYLYLSLFIFLSISLPLSL